MEEAIARRRRRERRPCPTRENAREEGRDPLRPLLGSGQRLRCEPSLRPSVAGQVVAVEGGRRLPRGVALDLVEAGDGHAVAQAIVRLASRTAGSMRPRPRRVPRSAEHRTDRAGLDARDQVAVSLPHLLGLVPGPGIDEPLVDPLRRAIADEAVAKDVEPFEHLPFRRVDHAARSGPALRPWSADCPGRSRVVTVAIRPLRLDGRPGPFRWPVVRLRFLLRAISPAWQNKNWPPGWTFNQS